ncbi:NIPSNAP family protein [Pantoea coffeiphila]|uniref:NIPSNAP family protein n=1 Tax=Pantoea coffeiphila TaxID=1465635 RepID=A0A2S9I736_9GAMM|nr:NIPSNAP family protein [Pantoea coffeiphila]PRD13595.1 NIPSNAP family protein [Pantoea coffeiphila]
MITCYVKYVIDPYQVREFECYALKWIGIVEEMGGIHHGYFLPAEGANNIAYCLFSFDSLAQYEEYRVAISSRAECVELFNEANKKKFILSYERSFMKPLMSDK